MYIDHIDEDIIAVTRQCPVTLRSVLLVTRTVGAMGWGDDVSWIRLFCSTLIPVRVRDLVPGLLVATR